jgi:hypothetical protein
MNSIEARALVSVKCETLQLRNCYENDRTTQASGRIRLGKLIKTESAFDYEIT